MRSPRQLRYAEVVGGKGEDERHARPVEAAELFGASR
jgi:hypothetical protein